MMKYNSPSRNHARHHLINLGHGSFECLNITNDTIFLCFRPFAGCLSRAHHKRLRRLKPCQYRRTVCWHCEFGKLVGMLISICWIHGQGAFVANVLDLTGCTLHFCKFDQMKKASGCFFVQIGSMV